MFVPEVARQHDVFARAITFDVFASSLSPVFDWIKQVGNSSSASTKLQRRFAKTGTCSPDWIHEVSRYGSWGPREVASAASTVSIAGWQPFIQANSTVCTAVTWWVAPGRGMTRAPAALTSWRGVTTCRVSVVTSLFTLQTNGLFNPTKGSNIGEMLTVKRLPYTDQ